ncbi:type III-A CRISPR-associated protein Csm2 [Brachyspira intermedia]|uniref:type III-A CRISPR-associated protein Csm2 n=2 Tax=Brachyspira intermedia TaxID=84377 RepID=UPI0030063154
MYMKNYDDYNKFSKGKEKNNNIDLKDKTLDIEEAQYFVQKYIIVNLYNGLKIFATTNQLRKFLSAVNEINNNLTDDDIISDNNIKIIKDTTMIKYMKTQLAYLVGRSRDNKDNYEKKYLKEIDDKINEYLSYDMQKKLSYMKEIDDKKSGSKKEIYYCKKGIEALYIRILPKIDLIISDKKLDDFKELARYIEAIVAYHRFYGGK